MLTLLFSAVSVCLSKIFMFFLLLIQNVLVRLVYAAAGENEHHHAPKSPSFGLQTKASNLCKAGRDTTFRTDI